MQQVEKQTHVANCTSHSIVIIILPARPTVNCGFRVWLHNHLETIMDREKYTNIYKSWQRNHILAHINMCVNMLCAVQHQYAVPRCCTGIQYAGRNSVCCVLCNTSMLYQGAVQEFGHAVHRNSVQHNAQVWCKLEELNIFSMSVL